MSRRVLVWRNEWLPPSETFVVNQITGMVRWTPVLAGLRVADRALLGEREVFTLQRPGPRWKAERAGFHRAGRSPSFNRVLRSVDLIHAHFGHDATTVLKSAQHTRKPLVVTFHGYDAMVLPEHRADRPMTQRWAELVATVALFLAVSDAIAGRLADLGVPQSKLRVHHIGIPLPPDIERGAGDGVLFVGRLVEKKGVDLLLEAMAALPPSLRDTSLTIVGDGPLRDAMERRAAELRLRVTFLGHQPPNVVDDEMRKAAILVAPSRTATNGDAEGLPIAPLEAAARRLPTVTCVSGGSADAVLDGSTGFVLPAEDQAGVTAAMGRLLRDPDMRLAMGAAGRRHVGTAFDIAIQTAELEGIYDETARAR